MSTRDTPTTYSAEEAARIKEMAGRPDASLVCPRCDTPLIRLTPTDARGAVMQELSCPECHRCIILRAPEAEPGHPPTPTPRE